MVPPARDGILVAILLPFSSWPLVEWRLDLRGMTVLRWLAFLKTMDMFARIKKKGELCKPNHYSVAT